MDAASSKATRESDASLPLDIKAFADDWHKEWTHGDFPRYKETWSHTWRDTKVPEDAQSDGKPSPGLQGKDVGAYLPYPLPKEH